MKGVSKTRVMVSLHSRMPSASYRCPKCKQEARVLHEKGSVPKAKDVPFCGDCQVHLVPA
jgi:hypothetical protein